MKPCCTLLTTFSPEEVKTKILNLSGSLSCLVLDGGDQLILKWKDSGTLAQKPILGSPAWELRIGRSDLGTVVDFLWQPPWRAWLGHSLIGLLVWGFWYFLGMSSGLTLYLAIGFSLLWPVFLYLNAFGARRGADFRQLRTLLKDTLEGY